MKIQILRLTDILQTWFILFSIYCAALKGRAAFCLTNDSIPLCNLRCAHVDYIMSKT